MGEIFRYERPTAPLQFTGERFTTAVGGQVELEHIHRYLMARSLCRGKDVLDIASGEGYGAAILAQVAHDVIGVDADQTAVGHALESYRRPNLRFMHGDARRIPLPDAAVDIVTSFETIEHFLEHEDFLQEVHRVLRPDGFLLISTPDCDVCSPSGRAANPFHVRELSRDEFFSELSAYFGTVSMFRQRPLIGSLIAKASAEPAADHLAVYEKRDESFFEENSSLTRAPYLIAIGFKTSPIKAGVASSVFIDTDCVDLQASELHTAKTEVAATRSELRAAKAEVVAARSEITQLQRHCDHLTGELGAIRLSSSWRLTRPLRAFSRRLRLLANSVKLLLSLRATHRRFTRSDNLRLTEDGLH